ncbi:MAG TPA: IS1595 family transposase [Candidatus Sulfotelmatobacter sp.]|nr:IS1595 family transposase [Candidatus Sulfotelmatobacter sp.]
MSLIDVTRKFATKDVCLDYLEQLRWPNGLCCIKCGVTGEGRIAKFTTNETTRERYSKTKGKVVTVKVPSRRLYECKDCGYQFSVTTGTVFHDSHLPLEKWMMAIGLMLEAKKGMSALQVARHLGMSKKNYKSTWYLCHRIREAMIEAGLLLSGDVEADETFIGAQTRRRKRFARPITKPKDIVMGMIERGGRLKLMPIADTKARIMQSVLEENISEHVGTIYTDEHPIYIFALKSKFPGKHKMIVHKRAFAVGLTHTNTIESAFSLFKRGLRGSFHIVSKKHLPRYCDEFSYRFNRREKQPQMFEETVKRLLDAKPLPFKELTASGELSEPSIPASPGS